MFEVRWEGLRELLQSLHTVELGLYQALLTGLEAAGRIVQTTATEKFETYGGGRKGFDQAAQGFRALVRPNSSSMALLSVGQTIRRSSDMAGRRSNFGDLMMRKALLPARRERMGDVVAALDEGVSELLRSHGF